jgi:hypothetical protein
MAAEFDPCGATAAGEDWAVLSMTNILDGDCAFGDQVS